MTPDVIASSVLIGLSTSLLVTVPVVLIGYGFRVAHLWK